MKTSRNPNLIELVITTLVVLVMWQVCKNIAQMTAVLLCPVGIAAVIKRTKRLQVCYYATVFGWMASLLAPIDILFRHADRPHVSGLRIMATHGLRKSIVDAEAEKGLLEGKDYVICDCHRLPLVAPRWGIVFFLP